MHRSELRDIVEAAERSETVAGEHALRFRHLMGLPGDIFSRHHFVPGHVTASAMLLSRDETAVALIDHHRLGVWLQPGGHVEPDDGSLLGAAMREAVEECGDLQLEKLEPWPFDLDVHDIPGADDEPAHAHFDVRFLLRVIAGELVATSEVAAADWFPLDAPPERLGDSVERMLERLRHRPPKA